MRSTQQKTPQQSEERLFLVTAVFACLWVFSAVLFWRKVAGQFQNPLTAQIACAITGLVLATGLLNVAVAWPAIADKRWRKVYRFAATLVVLGPSLLVAFALTPQASATGNLVQGTLMMLAIGLIVSLGGSHTRWKERLQDGRAPANSKVDPKVDPKVTPKTLSDTTASVLGHDLPSRTSGTEELLQQMTRVQTLHGREQLTGLILVRFEPGRKQAAIHVPFSPPFRSVPDITCKVDGADGVRVKAGLVQPYGARLELRRSQASAVPDAVRIVVRASAVAEPAPSA